MPKGKKAAFTLPKRIGGFKIPKKLRKSSGPMLAFLDTPYGREAAAGALLAIATSLAGRDWVKKAAGTLGRQAAEAGSAGGTVAQDVVGTAVSAIAGTAKHDTPSSADERTEWDPGGTRKAALSTTSLTSPSDAENMDRKRH